ncbi:MAG: hypothetical protein NTV23_09790 [Propionibacteriales bacterium]|nr:hypothetical protein [Propionibacteriales bacterium]
MRSKFVTVLTVIGAVTVLVLAANTVALATTGKAILAGKINTSSTLTSIVRTTPGTGLQVKTKSTANAPFAVNGTGKVVSLNADKVDGLDGGTRALKWIFTGTRGDTTDFALAGLPNGTYLVSYSVYFGSLSTADGLTSACYLRQTVNGGATVFTGETNMTETATSYPGLSATALVTKGTGGSVVLNCSAPSGGTWTATSSEPVQITAVPIAGVTNKGAPTVSKVAARR